jgi:hypothetical protein
MDMAPVPLVLTLPRKSQELLASLSHTARVLPAKPPLWVKFTQLAVAKFNSTAVVTLMVWQLPLAVELVAALELLTELRLDELLLGATEDATEELAPLPPGTAGGTQFAPDTAM